MPEWWPRAHKSWSYIPSKDFQILPSLKIFLTHFSETMKVRKLKFRKNMGNDLMYRVNSKRAQGSVTLGVMSLGRFSKKKKKKKKKIHFAQ